MALRGKRSFDLQWRPSAASARVLLATLLATTLAALAGCATTPPQVVYEPEAMRAEIARRVGPGHGTVEIPYEIDPALVELVREKTRGAPAGRARLAAIVDAVLVKHDLGVTADASRVFEERRGDCISATSLFVGLARAVGMEVVFVEAVGIEDVSAEESLDIYHRHVMAAWGPSPRATLVDFNRIGTEYVRFRVMSDLEALAHFHNTQGYQALRRDDLAEARRRFEIAVALAPELAWARNNLGVALRRTGDLENAEASFRQAISADPAYSSAYANLARLLEGQRRFDEARAMRELAEDRRARDPLRAFREGRVAFDARDFARAAEAYRKAVRLSPRFVRGHIELARAELAAGNGRDARRSIARALRLDPDDRYALAVDRMVRGLDAEGHPLRPAAWPGSKIDATAEDPSPAL